jgi:hypothetical protein
MSGRLRVARIKRGADMNHWCVPLAGLVAVIVVLWLVVDAIGRDAEGERQRDELSEEARHKYSIDSKSDYKKEVEGPEIDP